MAHQIVDTDGPKILYVKVENQVFKALHALAKERKTSLTTIGVEAFEYYLEAQEGS